MSALNISALENKYLKLPFPKDVILWRTKADDTLKRIQRVPYAFPRSTQRRRSGKPLSSKSIEVHLWRKPLDGWVPEDFDYIAIVERGLSLVWCIKSVDIAMEGVLYVCQCEQSTVPVELVSAISQYIQSGSSLLVQY